MQTTHLPKIPVVTYPLHAQLALARHLPETKQISQVETARDKDMVVAKSIVEEARGFHEQDDDEEEQERELRKSREAEERIFRDYLAHIIAWDVDPPATNTCSDASPYDSELPPSVPAKRTTNRPSFELRFTLRYKTETERLSDTASAAAATSGKTLPPKLYTLVLSFAQSRIYEPLESVHVPYLCRFPGTEWKRGQRSDGRTDREDHTDVVGASRLPYLYDIGITFRPLAPLPTLFPVTATFNDEEGNICEGQMEPLHLHFTDLFLPLPLPSVQDTTDPLFPSSSALLCMIWRQLWRHLGSTSDDWWVALPFIIVRTPCAQT